MKYFSPKLFKFLRDLKRNNSRKWFLANKHRYEDDVKQPLLNFITDFAGPLSKISHEFVSDPKPSGGSMFRIYRDMRFSADKSPYKLAASAHFRHSRARDVHAPGFYLHLEPNNVFAGVGLWHPDNPSLKKIRDTMVKNPRNWTRARDNKAFNKLFDEGDGEMLKRPPQGYDPDHPLIEDLKKKDFTAFTDLSEKQAVSSNFLDRFAKACVAAKPFMEYLTKAVGLRF